MHRRWLSATAILAGIAIVAAACGQAAPSSGGGADKGEIIIASNFPTSGADRASGRGPEAGVAYAIPLNGNIQGFKITHQPHDHAVNGGHDPQKGAPNFTPKVAIWSDNETVGKGVADNFGKRVTAKGGMVVVRQDFDVKSTNDFRPFLQRAKDAGAQAIYAGATSATKGCIPRAQMKSIFTTDIPYLGPDGIGDTQCIKDAGDNATTNLYFTNAAAEAAQDPANKALIDDFKAKFTQKEDLGAYTFPGYDCAKILLDAISRAIDLAGGKMPTRDQVVQAVQDTKGLKLSTGTYSFDKNGDPTSATMAFYQYKGGDWSFVKQFSVGQ